MNMTLNSDSSARVTCLDDDTKMLMTASSFDFTYWHKCQWCDRQGEKN